MASGNYLAVAQAASADPLSSGMAEMSARNQHIVLAFDAASAENAVFSGILPAQYAGGGVTLVLQWMGASATSGNVKWNAAIERNDAAGLDLDADSFASAQTTTTAAQGTSGAISSTSIAFTSGAQMDSLAAGERFRLKITRDAADGGDTMTGDAQLLSWYLKET